MQTPVRKFIVTTKTSPEGVLYTYDRQTELFVGVEIVEHTMPHQNRARVITTIKDNLNQFLEWVTANNLTVVEMEMKITFDMFWLKYDDRNRSSKKRSEKLWGKLSEADQVKAYYHYDKYNRNRGNAEKKYCETYLNAELWNN